MGNSYSCQLVLSYTPCIPFIYEIALAWGGRVGSVIMGDYEGRMMVELLTYKNMYEAGQSLSPEGKISRQNI